jgi:hypothetical protein
MGNNVQSFGASSVDNLKISHMNPKVVTDMISELESHFGKMPVTRGRDEHPYLGLVVRSGRNPAGIRIPPEILTGTSFRSGISVGLT